MISGVGIRAYRDLSRPEAWSYWKDQYFSPTIDLVAGHQRRLQWRGRGRSALFITGKIGAASATWFRDRLAKPVSRQVIPY